MYRSDFFDNEGTTTLTSNKTVSFHQNDFVQITGYNRHNDTTGSTVQGKVLYRVKTYTNYSVDVTPVNPAQVDSWFPSRRELNRLAAIAGGQAEESKHSRTPKKALVLRSSYQGMARLPCYRGTRPR